MAINWPLLTFPPVNLWNIWKNQGETLMQEEYGPSIRVSEEIHAAKYRGDGESFSEAQARVAHTLSDSSDHFRTLYNILLDMRFMGGGRVQAAIGAPRTVTAFNCL